MSLLQRIQSAATERAVEPPLPLAPKLEIGAVDDPLEKEADRIADRVMQMPAHGTEGPERNAVADTVTGMHSPRPDSTPSLGGLRATVQRKCASCEEDDSDIRRKESSGGVPDAGAAMRAYVGSLGGGGRPLAESSRRFFEPRFGYDFSRVRVFADAGAAQSAASIHALAYTNGNRIVFGQGQYSPGSRDGDRLLAHELAHVVQQESAPSIAPKIQRACTPAEVTALNLTMHGFCDQPRRCNMQTDTCATATAKVAAGYGCTSFRALIQQKCFKPGDPGYEDHMKQLAQAYAALRNCQAVMSAKCAEEEAAREEAAAEAEAEAEAAETAEAAEGVEATAAVVEGAEGGVTLLEVLEVVGAILAL
jgi:hypothetical protein